MTLDLREYIEFHDSRVSIEFDGDSVVLVLCPAYVHRWHRQDGQWTGMGRTQDARMRILHADPGSGTSRLTCVVADGVLAVGAVAYTNMVPVPLVSDEHVLMSLDIVAHEPVEVRGRGLVLELLGEGRDVEPLPPEWEPE